MEILNKLWFSQASLSAWLSCPLKFKYRYIDGLYWPLPSGKTLQNLETGRKFHLLAQSHFNGRTPQLPPDEDPALGSWLSQLQQWLPIEEGSHYLSEYELRLNEDGLRLLSKYDLIVCSGDDVVIYDWKTNAKPPARHLLSSPQTRLYLYLLCSVPRQIAVKKQQALMKYWNPRYPDQPLAINYSEKQWEEDGKWLRELIAEIRADSVFPATTDEKKCRYCEYRPVCHGRGLEGEAELDLDIEAVDWDEIEEISLQGAGVP